MVTLHLTFPAGRFHATPYDRQVNEGAVEWPPSPWRIVRALIATWHLKASEEIDEAELRSIVDKLAAGLPTYRLPLEVSEAHTRHYMPIRKGKGETTTKVFDTWLNLPKDAVVEVCWEVELGAQEREALATLAERLAYLGRAESWVRARLVDELDDPSERQRRAGEAGLVGPSAGPVPDGHQIERLLAPANPADYQRWRKGFDESWLERRLEQKRDDDRRKGKDPEGSKLTKTDRRNAAAMAPDTLFEALQASTDALQSDGWSQPPGARWVEYARPVIGRPPPFPDAPQRSGQRPTVARFALSAKVLPRLTEALAWADAVHSALVSRSEGQIPLLRGTDEEGKPLADHDHLFILPESHGEHGRITHLTLYAGAGFDAQARQALRSLRRVWKRGDKDLTLLLVGLDHPDQLAGLDAAAGQCPSLAASRVWRSRTPFVSTLYPKTKRSGAPKLDERGIQKGGPEYDLRRLLELQGFPAPRVVEQIDTTTLGGKEVRWLDFKTHVRGRSGRRGPCSPVGFRIEFDEQVRGPIALGFGAHFGLGRFEPGRFEPGRFEPGWFEPDDG